MSESFVIGCADGSFHFISDTGRNEKRVLAHTGSVLCIRWSNDCSSLLTTGEDGHVKIWSRNGTMRMQLHSSSTLPIYKACWSPTDDRVIFSSGRSLVIKSVDVNGKALQWEAHSGLVRALDWSATSDLIVSAGEDARFRLWDSFGKELHCSHKFDHTITSVAFSPNGEYLVIGSFNLIVLCDKSALIHCTCRVVTGSILDLAWSFDGTEIAGGCANGSLLLAYLSGTRVETAEFEAIATERQKVCVRNLADDSIDELIVGKDRIVEMDANDEWLIVATLSQCYIYNFANLNTPFIIDLKSSPLLLHMSKTHFSLVDAIDGLRVLSFEGKSISTPRHQRVRLETTTKSLLSLVSTHLALVDSFDKETVYLFDVLTGRETCQFVHRCPISRMCLLEPRGGFQEPGHLLAIVLDSSRDLSILSINLRAGAKGGNAVNLYKLCANADSFLINSQYGSVACISDRTLMVWHCPWVAFYDKDLVAATVTCSDLSSAGHHFALVYYAGHRVQLRGSDGSTTEYREMSPSFMLLHQLSRDGMWREAVMLCRNQRDDAIWSALASLALARKQLDVAEIAFCEVSDAAKVFRLKSNYHQIFYSLKQYIYIYYVTSL